MQHAKRRFCSYRCSAFVRHADLKARGYVYPRRFTDEVVTEAVAMVRSGLTWKEAAESVGMGPMHLRKRASELGIKPKRRGRVSYAPLRLHLPTDACDLAYIAGIMDGDGSITISRGQRNVVRVCITNTNRDLIDWLQTIGGGVVRKPVGRNLGTKVCFTWQLYGRRDTLAFLDAVAPHMKIKRAKALEAAASLREWIGVADQDAAFAFAADMT